jgi:antirestriction protein ArdC
LRFLGSHGGGAAFYVPARDTITLPPRAAFPIGADYYGTLFHELTHSTGHPSRLNRLGVAEVAPFGSPVYSREELVAELGAAFLCGIAALRR